MHGIYKRQMAGMVFGSPIVEVTARGRTVPPPNNALINGALATFEEFPSTPRIDILSPTLATRGQSRPVYEYQVGVDPTTGLPLTTKVGTSGIYTDPGNVLVTGASLLGAVTDFPSGTVTFPYYSVPGAPPGTRFDQFPGGPAVTNGTIIAFYDMRELWTSDREKAKELSNEAMEDIFRVLAWLEDRCDALEKRLADRKKGSPAKKGGKKPAKKAAADRAKKAAPKRRPARRR